MVFQYQALAVALSRILVKLRISYRYYSYAWGDDSSARADDWHVGGSEFDPCHQIPPPTPNPIPQHRWVSPLFLKIANT